MQAMTRLALLAIAAMALFSMMGCAGPGALAPPSASPAPNPGGPNAGAGGADAGAAGAGGAAEPAGWSFNEWAAPDGSVTLQVPQGWTAGEKRVDNCTVSWSATDPAGTSSAYMSNEIMVFKSENARQTYQAYGMKGIDSAPVSGYRGAEAAVQQIIAPLTGASNVSVTYEDAAESRQLSALCIRGLAACDARVFEAAYRRNGALMRGRYFVQTWDLGDGATWWINIWGYTSPAADWSRSAPGLEKTFASVRYTDAWAGRCRPQAGDVAGLINGVVAGNRAASEKAAQGWDAYVRGE